MRLANWERKLADEIERARFLPFQWGVHDCCLFAADVVQALTGVDHAAELRGIYRTLRTAERILKKRGGVRQIATDALGPEISPLMAQRGDVVLLPTEYGEALAVCIGAYCVAPGEDGLQSRPLADAITAWRVA